MKETVQQFRTEGTVIKCIPFGSGHINQTWLVVTNQPHLYILQRVNTETFRDPEGLMNNILMVTEHLRKQDPDPRHVMTLVKLKDGRDYILNDRKELWRMYEYVTGGVCMDRAETAEDFRNSGSAFGTFQKKMADFPAEQLTETIPGFHDTPKRYEALHEAIREDRAGRVKDVQPEIGFMLEREAGAGLLQRMLRAGELPLRVTHNDTKLNNVMLDEKTREPLCILDLDKVHLDLELYRAYAEGFLGACGDRLTKAERETLPDGARIITLENAVRFLTDYLNGDTYYHIERPEHNLDRTRTQMALTREMEKNDGIIRKMMSAI